LPWVDFVVTELVHAARGHGAVRDRAAGLRGRVDDPLFHQPNHRQAGSRASRWACRPRRWCSPRSTTSTRSRRRSLPAGCASCTGAGARCCGLLDDNPWATAALAPARGARRPGPRPHRLQQPLHARGVPREAHAGRPVSGYLSLQRGVHGARRPRRRRAARHAGRPHAGGTDGGGLLHAAGLDGLITPAWKGTRSSWSGSRAMRRAASRSGRDAETSAGLAPGARRAWRGAWKSSC
jgi:hypothetical protein